MSVTLPPRDGYWLLHLASFLSHLSNTTFHTSSFCSLLRKFYKGKELLLVGKGNLKWLCNIINVVEIFLYVGAIFVQKLVKLVSSVVEDQTVKCNSMIS